MSVIANLVAKQTLKDYTNGAAKQSLSSIAEFLAPTVQVPGLVGYYKSYSTKGVRHILNTKRAVNGRAVELRRDATDVPFLLEANAIDCPVDQALLTDETAIENELMSAADDVAEAGSLAHEAEVIDLALATVGSGTNSNFTSGSVDPVDVLDAQINAILLAAGGGGLQARVLFGPTAWQRFKNNSNVRNRYLGGRGSAKSGPGGASLATPTLDAIGDMLVGNETKGAVSYMVKDTAAVGVATPSYTWLLDTAILIFAAKTAPTRNSPDFMKTFRPRGAWMVPGSYKREDGRGEVAKMDWYCKPVVVNSSAAGRINATNS